MSQPPQDGPGPQDRPPQGQGEPPQRPGEPPQGQGGPPQSGPPGQPPYPPQGYPQPGYPPQQGYPAQGYPPQPGQPQQQGYPPQRGYPGQQPYAPAPYQQQQPYPPGRYGPVPGQPGQPGQAPKKKRTGLFVLIGAGALALILAVVAIAVNLGGRNDTAGGGGATTGGGGSASAPAAATASDAVNGYLQAIAKGDAATAVSYAADPSTVSTTYMTPEVLAASAKAAPLTDIQVGTSDPDATTVPVSYKLGSTSVSTSLDVMKTSDDVWKLVSVAADLDLTAVQDSGVPMLMNGTKVKPGPFSVLPGAYHFTTGQRNFDYGKHPDLVVRYPSDFPDITRIAPGISSAGRQAALSALRKSWSKCLKSDQLKPSGCPNRWTRADKTYKFKNGSIKWSRKGSDPVKKPVSQQTTSTVRYQVTLDLTLKGKCTISGQPGTCSGYVTGTGLARADISADKVRLTWQT